jgi:hypothetical protein
LAESDQVRIFGIGNPATTEHQLVAKIAEMRDRPAERGAPQSQEDTEDLKTASALGLPAFGGGHVDRRTHVWITPG